MIRKDGSKDNEQKIMVVVSYVVIEQDGKILMTHEKDRKGWKLPGGWLDWGEKIEDACRREIKEEVNGEVKFNGFLGVWQHFGETDHRIVFGLSAKADEKTIFKPVSDDIEAIEMVDINDPRLRDETNYFKKRFYLIALEYLDGNVQPIEMIRRETSHSQ